MLFPELCAVSCPRNLTNTSGLQTSKCRSSFREPNCFLEAAHSCLTEAGAHSAAEAGEEQVIGEEQVLEGLKTDSEAMVYCNARKQQKKQAKGRSSSCGWDLAT
jgi:hypothetical protein